MVFPRDGSGYDALVKFWVPEESARQREKRDRVPYSQWIREGWIKATPGDSVDYDIIRADINELRERYDIREIAADRWNATQIIGQLDGDGFTIFAHGQGFRDMSAPAKEFERAIIAQQIATGKNPVMRWMVCELQHGRGRGRQHQAEQAEVNRADRRAGRAGYGNGPGDRPGRRVYEQYMKRAASWKFDNESRRGTSQRHNLREERTNMSYQATRIAAPDILSPSDPKQLMVNTSTGALLVDVSGTISFPIPCRSTRWASTRLRPHERGRVQAVLRSRAWPP